MNKWLYVLGAVLIGGFGALGVIEMQEAQTPYVTTVAQARKTTDRPIQFMGELSPKTAKFDRESQELRFSMKDDDGNTLRVRYRGVKPSGFDTAESAVVRGTYRGGELVASQVSLKCPSKYKSRLKT